MTTTGLLRTGSFSDKISKKWSLPVPSTTSRGSRGSESTETSYTSRSSAEIESLSGGEISPVSITHSFTTFRTAINEGHVFGQEYCHDTVDKLNLQRKRYSQSRRRNTDNRFILIKSALKANLIDFYPVCQYSTITRSISRSSIQFSLEVTSNFSATFVTTFATTLTTTHGMRCRTEKPNFRERKYISSRYTAG